MSNITYKTLYGLVEEQIDSKIKFNTSSSYPHQTSRISVSPIVGDGRSDASTAQLVTAIQDLLGEALPAWIISGLEVSETDPISSMVIIQGGKGTVGGNIYELTNTTVINIPFDTTSSIFYITLFKNSILIEKTYDSKKLTIAKIVVPKPGTTSLIQDNKDESWNAYIVNFKEYKLYGYKDKFEEDTIELLKDNIQPIVADLLIGNIKLSEGLKITNTQGSLELDSSEMKILSTDDIPLAKFNRRGTFFYDNNGIEIARFSTDDAKIGNILITKNSIGSGDFISGDKGFKIQDNGFAEFEDVRIRGRISSSVFESDKISAVGGKLYVGNSSVLAMDVGSTDTTIIVEDYVFSLNEVLTIRNGDNQEWLLVTNITNAPAYIVTRDISNSFPTDPSWSKGTAVVSTGVGGSGYTETGYILLDAISNYSPFIDISLRESEVYDDVSTKVRLGNLGGITDDLYGTLSGYGLYSDNVFLKGKLYAPDIKTAITGSRAEMNTCCFTIYDTLGDQVFDIKYSGGSAGDVTIGDLQSQYLFWNNSLDKLEIKSVSDGNCFELSNGNIIANSMTLKDPTCECCYSYLNSGQWYFHDELGNTSPYVKRLCAGSANTGTTVCLPYWKGQPYVQISIKDLAAYDPNYSVNCQKWCVYYDNLICYYNCAIDYGWKFNVHANLYKASGVYDEVTKDVAFDVSVYTHSDAYWTTIRNRFLLWCFTCTSSTCYGYGTLCYQIKYKCCVGGCAWTCSSYTYSQPHDSSANLTTCYDICQNICFPSGGCWELQLNCVSLTWCLTTINAITLCCCNRDVNCCTGGMSLCNCYVPYSYDYYYTSTSSDCVLFCGSNPPSTYCAYICYSSCTCLLGLVGTASFYEGFMSCFSATLSGCVLETQCYRAGAFPNEYTGSPHYSCSFYNTCSCFNLTPNYNYDYINRCFRVCLQRVEFVGCAHSLNTTFGMNLIQCYCVVPSNCTCEYERLWSLKDYSETQTILDPNGILNYLTVGYS